MNSWFHFLKISIQGTASFPPPLPREAAAHDWRMSWVPLGKVLLRNVIRHTDAHNKIQEESDMWKIELEKQMEDAYRETKRKMLPSSSSRMRSDGFDEESQRDYWRTKNEISGTLEDDFLKTKSWNKKLYDYEANMPDRWGHSGYKELYPEEFETDSDQQDITNGKKNLLR